MKKTSPFIYYLLFYAAASFTLPFIVLFFQSLGFNGAQIGLLTAMAPLVTMLGAPLWTGLADARNKNKLLMSLSILGAVIFASLFPLFKTLTPIIFLAFLYSLFSSPITPFADSATMTMLEGEKDMYGRIRLGGTIGWGLMAPIAGLIIQTYGIRWAFWGYAAIMLLVFVIIQKFTFGKKLDVAPISSKFRNLLTSRKWVFFMILAFASGVGFASINTYLFPYMEELGISRSTMGLALTISTLGELPILFFANRLLKRFGAYKLLRLGMVVTGVRLLLYAWFNFPAGILIFQLLNGMTFPMIWVAGVSYADENAPRGMKSTAQGMLGAMVTGIGAAVGGLAGGLLLGSLGGRWLYVIFGSFVLLSLAVVSLLDKRERTGQAKALI